MRTWIHTDFVCGWESQQVNSMDIHLLLSNLIIPTCEPGNNHESNQTCKSPDKWRAAWAKKGARQTTNQTPNYPIQGLFSLLQEVAKLTPNHPAGVANWMEWKFANWNVILSHVGGESLQAVAADVFTSSSSRSSASLNCFIYRITIPSYVTGVTVDNDDDGWDL